MQSEGAKKLGASSLTSVLIILHLIFILKLSAHQKHFSLRSKDMKSELLINNVHVVSPAAQEIERNHGIKATFFSSSKQKKEQKHFVRVSERLRLELLIVTQTCSFYKFHNFVSQNERKVVRLETFHCNWYDENQDRLVQFAVNAAKK